MPINQAWHEANPMPGKPTAEQRYAWHREHAQQCGCRPMPAKLAEQFAEAEGSHVPTRQEALDLLREFNSKESLIKHALAVEAAMRAFARENGADEEQWGVIGLVHDLDYDRYPEAHCHKTAEILEERGWPREYIRAVLSHGWGFCTEEAPESLLEKTLYTVDELAGFVTACALVRPSKSVFDLETASVLKKWKQKEFAATVSRSVVEEGAAMLGMPLADVIDRVILALRGVADEIGLRGSA
jgi:putative nucleotidyltransferase with HDIG domain